MAVITIPAAVAATIGGQSYGQARYDIMETSEPTGASAVRVLGPPRWTFGLSSKQALNLADAGEWEAMLLRLRGGINHLAVYDRLRTAPLGNVRGNIVLNASVAIGATTLALAKITDGKNLLAEGTTFGGTSWVLINGGTVTSNVASTPLGASITADQITDDSNTLSEGVRQDVAIADDAATYTVSIYVKATTGATAKTPNFQLELTGGTPVSINLQFNTDTGAGLLGSPTVTSADGGAWWRLSGSLTNNASGNTLARVRFDPSRCAHNSAVTDVTQMGSHIVWGAQLEVGATLTSYVTTRNLLAGDWLQVGTGVGTSQLVKVAATVATGSSDLLTAVTFEPPLRYAFSAGDPVTWDKPLAYCKLTNSRLSWGAKANGPAIDGFAADLIEDWG